jgi:hypothetical protein
MSLNKPLFKGYLLKEQLRGILQHPWRYLGVSRKRLEEWLEAARTAGLDEIRRVAERLASHVEAVVAGHEHKIKLGLVEAINSKSTAKLPLGIERGALYILPPSAHSTSCRSRVDRVRRTCRLGVCPCVGGNLLGPIADHAHLGLYSLKRL